jgi:heme exporter protein B
MKLVSALIVRDLRSALIGGAWLPVAFFLLVAILFPFGVGPDGALLTRTGGGVLWVAALLAALLPVDRLIAPDAETGVLDQLAVRGVSEELIVAAKFVAHWLSFGPLLMLAAIPAAGLLRLEGVTLVKLEIGLAVGTPGLAALGVMASCLMLPLAVPLLIFGAGSLAPLSGSALSLLGAASLFLCAITPFAGGAALRSARE